jgi:phage-related protein (TIGR01555 family)
MTETKKNRFWSWLMGSAAIPPEKAVEAVSDADGKRVGMTISAEAQARSKLSGRPEAKPFKPAPIPDFIKERMKAQNLAELAMDSDIASTATWAGSYWGPNGYAFTEGLEFLGYPYLAELAQRPEYRRIVEIIAQEATRKWIRITSADDGDDDEANDDARSDKIAKIIEEMDRLNVREVFKTISEQDGFYGRSHLYIDTGDSDNPEELKTPIGDGDGKISKAKVNKNKPILALRTIEAVWTYPTNYNSNDPLKGDWYNPDMWFVMGKQVHVSRLLCFIGRPVPDLLKPAYSFGGLALTQMAKPYVDNWLQTRQSVNDIISAFSVFVLKTNMSAVLQGGGMEAEMARAAIFNNLRNNRGLFMVDKDLEEFDNVSAPLGSLDALQAQSQEHMAAVCGIPLVKLLGITPQGLNASSEGEIRVFYDSISAYQEAFFRDNLTKVLKFVQLSLFGEVDKAITFQFEGLHSLTEKEQAEARKFDAETDIMYIDGGVVSPDEVRAKLASNPNTPYHIKADDEGAPDLMEEEEAGLIPKGGGGATKALFEAEEVKE